MADFHTYLTDSLDPAPLLPAGYRYPTQVEVGAIVALIIGGDNAAVAAAAVYGVDVTHFPTISVTMTTSPKDSSHSLNGFAAGASATGTYTITVPPSSLVAQA
jgi:hypothetical protein